MVVPEPLVDDRPRSSVAEGPPPTATSDGVSGTPGPMGPGTLYGALARLERRGLVEALDPVERRRPYRLTGLGATTLEDQLRRLRSFVDTGLARLRGRAT